VIFLLGSHNDLPRLHSALYSLNAFLNLAIYEHDTTLYRYT